MEPDFEVGAPPLREPPPARRPRDWRRRLGPVAALGVMAAATLLVRPHGKDAPAPTPSPTNRPAPVDPGLALVTALARDPRPLTDYVRSNSGPGDCALVPLGAVPQRAAAAAVRRVLPTFAVRDVARTLDQFTALCSLQIRASDAHGSTLVLQVASAHVPARVPLDSFDHVIVGFDLDGGSVVSIVSTATRSGWSVLVGALGPVSDQPSSAAMQQLAQDPALLW